MRDPHAIDGLLAEIGCEAERRGPRAWSVSLPSTRRQAIGALLDAGERTLVVRAFFMRGPDRRHEELYRSLLRKNLASRSWRFALDDAGDVFLVADAPLAALDGPALDGLLGELCTLVDESYESAVRTGFEVPEGTEFRPPP